MPVLSVSLPSSRVSHLAGVALLHGIEADLIDRDGPVSYVDLIGRQDKIDAVSAPDYIEIIEQNDSVPHDEPVYTMIGRHFQ